MQAVLLAGGKGTRLHPLTTHVPKPMAPLFNRPVLEHTILLLRQHGIRHLIITLSYRALDIIERFGGGSRWGVSIQYAIEDTPRGTAGGLRAMQPLLQESFFVLSGDGVTDFNLSQALATHRERGAEATMLLYRVPDPAERAEFGVVRIDSAGRILRFQEKPAPRQACSDLVNTGVYILEPSVIERIPETGSFDFSRDLFPQLLAEKANFYGLPSSGYWCDIGNLRQYRQVHQDALAGKVALNLGYLGATEISQGVWIEQGARIHPSVKFLGPCYVSRGADIQENVIVAQGAVLGSDSRVGARSHIVNSVVGANAQVGTGVQLTDCIVGDGCLLTDGDRHQSEIMTRDLGALAICARTGRALPDFEGAAGRAA